jgi:hypothetical protein
MHADQYKGLPPIVPLSGGKPFAFVVFSKLALSLYISGSVRSNPRSFALIRDKFFQSVKISAIRVISGQVLALSVARLFVFFPQSFK